MSTPDETIWMDLAEEAGTLREAMVTRAAIEQAKGVLMALRRCTADQAFEELREVSQRRNVKLHVLAETLLATVANVRAENPEAVEIVMTNWVDALRDPSAPVVDSDAERAWAPTPLRSRPHAVRDRLGEP